MKFSGVITNEQSKVHAQGQGQRSKVKVTEVTTQLNRFRTVTPIWIHIWWRNHAYGVRLLGGWHFIAATAIKPPKEAACQFAADDILLYKFAIISNGFTLPFGKKEKKNCHLYNTILSLYISYQDITRRVC